MGRARSKLAAAAATALAGSMLMAAAAHAAAPAGAVNERVCGAPASGKASCLAILHHPARPAAGSNGHKPHTEPVEPVSYGAAALQSAYGLLGATGGAGRAVAVVDAYDDPNAFADLAAYRETEGLPPIAQCTPAATAASQTPCFAKVNQAGEAAAYPTGNTSWAEEISLDLDMVSATCPNCNVVLVEAETNSFANLMTAEDTAAAFGPVAIGNSYGGSEFSSEETYANAHYSHPGIAITASSGDNGYGVEFPAAAASVIAVGGTSLKQTSGGWSETVWSGSGSGCSAYVVKPSWQSDSGCARRTVADVAAVADPNTGVRVYDSFNEPGWMVFGGTSASAQIVAGIYALAGSGAGDASGLYRSGTTTIPFGSPNPGLFDVTSGSNGSCAGRGRFSSSSLAYLCTGTVGYDGPTGMGTPRGTPAF